MSDHRPIALLGLRCAGKSTVGRLLAESLDRPFVDLDHELLTIARRAGVPETEAGRLLATAGVAAFREWEATALRRLLEATPRVVLATGGGVVERADSRSWLARTSTCIYLHAAPAVLAERMRRDATLRPGLLGGDPVGEIPLLLARRDPLYRALAAHVLEVDAEAPDRVVRRIEALLGMRTVSDG